MKIKIGRWTMYVLHSQASFALTKMIETKHGDWLVLYEQTVFEK